MIKENLISDFDELLVNADEIWFSVALIKETTFVYIQDSINLECKQNYIVGIDLPTHPKVLRKMQIKIEKDAFESVIYMSDKNFHPKVYLFKNNNRYTAFVGSSNLTDGGLEDNIELNYKIINQEECISILNWFKNLLKDCYPLTEENVSEYEKVFDATSELEKEIKKERKKINLKKTVATNNSFDEIDFSDRYFKKEHHLAFRKELWKDSSSLANRERYEVQEMFLKLNDEIFPKFRDYGIDRLDHNTKNHIVSMYHHIEGATSQNLGAMWLSYGKTQTEIKKYKEYFPKVSNKKNSNEEDDKMSFINHSRLQIRIDLNSIGIWLLFGKSNGGSEFDRNEFEKKMLNVLFRDKFYSIIKSLPSEYFIFLNETKKFCCEFNSSNELYDFCKKDNRNTYFYIGRNYQITDVEMSENNLPKETLEVFQLLYPLYDMMIHKF